MRVRRTLVLLALVLSIGEAVTAQPTAPASAADASALAVQTLLQDVERAARAGDPNAYLALVADDADRGRATEFAGATFRPGATRVVCLERERLALATTAGQGPVSRLIVDLFTEYNDEARIDTLQFEVADVDGGLRIVGQDVLSSVDQLFRLSVSRVTQYEARGFEVRAEDLLLTLVEGTVFRIDTPEGPTGLILIGHGELRFEAAPDTEKGQVRIFSGEPVLNARFDAAYLRFRNVSDHADLSTLEARAIDARLLRRAEQIFKEESAKSYVLDLADLSREPWSLLPRDGDLLAEIRTRRFGTLTYARSGEEPEDIALFERRRQRNIAVYASKAKLAQRGRFYDEDALAAYDILHHDIDLSIDPERYWLVGSATMRLRVKRAVAAQLTIRLADSLVVQSIESDRFGRLFGLRSKGQNALLISLPVTMMPESEITLTIEYAGRLPPQGPDRETVAIGQQGDAPPGGGPGAEGLTLRANRGEPNFVYSNLSYWYPQAPITDYATARLHITVPGGYSCVASGTPEPRSPLFVTAVGSLPGKLYMFRAERPVRYLSFVVSRFERTEGTPLTFAPRELPRSTVPPNASLGILMVPRDPSTRPAPPPPPVHTALTLSVEANPRQAGRSRDHLARAADIVRYFDSLIGDIPYDNFTMALTEHITPGGHSPGYFAILNQALPVAGTVTWRNDPAAFDNFPEFFLAHEIAHQWWGQAVGWRNYHEQWLSEGFAQYFAALYAEHDRGPEAFGDVLRHMRKWAMDTSGQGPVYLGYRLGHIRNEGRVHRALVYNKGGMVLHMLRGLLGDETFFAGIRRFYADWRYRKAGTDDFRLAMEATSGRSLERFFERWIYGSAIPAATLSARVEAGTDGQRLTITVEQQQADLFDFPLVVRVNCAGRPAERVTLAVSDRITTASVPLTGTFRDVEIDRDQAPLVDVQRLP